MDRHVTKPEGWYSGIVAAWMIDIESRSNSGEINGNYLVHLACYSIIDCPDAIGGYISGHGTSFTVNTCPAVPLLSGPFQNLDRRSIRNGALTHTMLPSI
jgi:hypothetical protein